MVHHCTHANLWLTRLSFCQFRCCFLKAAAAAHAAATAAAAAQGEGAGEVEGQEAVAQMVPEQSNAGQDNGEEQQGTEGEGEASEQGSQGSYASD